MLYGNFDWSDDEGKVFRYDEIYDLFRNNIESDPTAYLTCDVARLWDDKTVIALWKWLKCFKIITYAQNTTTEVAQRIKELETEFEIRRANILIDSDWVGGGVADMLRGCVNFVNSATPFKNNSEKTGFVIKNFGNMKTQCYFKLKELMEKRLIRIENEWSTKENLMRELENIYVKNTDKEGKIMIESKELLRKRINRSSDFADAIMMRMRWVVRDLEATNSSLEWVFEVDYSWFLY